MRISTSALSLCVVAALLTGLALKPAQAVPHEPRDFFEMYELDRNQGAPTYVTGHYKANAHAMLVDDTASEFEEQEALPTYSALMPLLRGSIGRETGSERRSLNFLAVLESLLAGTAPDNSAPDPHGVAHQLQLVDESAGTETLPLMKQRIDYSQFRVRIKSADSAGTRRYPPAGGNAKTVWIPFIDSGDTAIGPSDAEELTRAAVLISQVVTADHRTAARFEQATAPLGHLFDAPHSMGIEEYVEVAPRVGGDYRLGGAAMPRLWVELFAQSSRLRVLGGIMDTGGLEPGMELEEALFCRQLLPGCLASESGAFQELVFDSVKGFCSEGWPFMLGSAGGHLVNVIFSALKLAPLQGFEEAAQGLRESGDTEFERYVEAHRRTAAPLSVPSGLATEHFALFRSWPVMEGPVRPRAERCLITAIGFWVLQRHGTVRQAKQFYRPSAKGIPTFRSPGAQSWIEPAEEFYRGRAESPREIARVSGFEPLSEYADRAALCADLSGQTLARRAFGTKQTEFLNDLDLRLRHLSCRKDGPVVADFHTDADSGQVAEIAVVARQVASTLPHGGVSVQGGRFRVHQFKQPLDERLDVEALTHRVRRGEAPAALFSAMQWQGAGTAVKPVMRGRVIELGHASE